MTPPGVTNCDDCDMLISGRCWRHPGATTAQAIHAAAALASRETYTEEGGYIVTRQLARTRRERDEARAALATVLALCDSWDNGAPMSTVTTWWTASQVRAACADTPTEATTVDE